MKMLHWLTRGALLGAGALSSGIVLGYGCESPTQFDDLCGWLADPNSCYREFFIDVGARCGDATVKAGQFLARDKLDLCILSEGGQVVVDPPIDLANPPPDNLEPITFTFINSDATECGNVVFTAKYDFSITIAPDPPPADGSDPPESAVAGGTFSMTGGKSSDILDTKCPSGGGSFTFDRLQVTRCEAYEDLLPHAEIDFNPGGIDQAGVVRLYVYYPPQDGELNGAAPVPVNYFECVIPGAPQPCENGIKDGSETDVDCGGSFCSTKCQDSQSCITNDDCASGACNLVMGIRMCVGP
jgi:hypothetical protein